MESICNENNLCHKLLVQSKMEFDYEVSSVKFLSPDEDKQVFFYDKLKDGKNFGKNYLKKANWTMIDFGTRL